MYFCNICEFLLAFAYALLAQGVLKISQVGILDFEIFFYFLKEYNGVFGIIYNIYIFFFFFSYIVRLFISTEIQIKL